MHNNPILAFDCAGNGASITLFTGVSATSTLPQGKQAASLVSSIDALLKEANLTYAQMKCIVTTIGPGSFTGLRIGLAALHGFVLVHRTPIKLLTSLEALAWQIARKPDAPKQFLITFRAGKGEVYVQQFSLVPPPIGGRLGGGQSQSEASHQSSPPPNLPPMGGGVIPVASGEIHLEPETKTDWPLPCFSDLKVDTELLCEIAAELPDATLADALPLYIRAPDAIIPQPLPWLA